MALLDFNRKTSFNAIPREDFQELILSTFNSVAEVLGNSLGPLGSTTTILDGMYTSATKDGWTIFNHLRAGNIYKAMIFNLIKGPCSRLNNTVGDGTTTAVVLTSLIFKAYSDHREEIERHYRLPREFTAAWDSVVAELGEIIRGYAKKLPREKVRDIAYVASNGNDEIADNLQRIYDEATSPVVKLRGSPTNHSYVEAIRGFDFPANLTDDAYVKNEDLSATYENLRVLVFDFKVDSEIFEKVIVPINTVYRSMKLKLLVIAPAYDELLVKTVMRQYASTEWRMNEQQFNLIISQYLYGKLEGDQLDNLAVLLRTKKITRYEADDLVKELGKLDDDGDLFGWLEELETDRGAIENQPFDRRQFIGLAPVARLSVHNGSTFSGFDTAGNLRYQQALDTAIRNRDEIVAKTEADKQNFSMEVARANANIAQLTMETYIYYVGADSSLQADVLSTAVDDVIKAVSSAIKHGTVPGCQVSIILACDQLLNRLAAEPDPLKAEIVGVIRSAVIELYSKVLMGPNGNGMSEDEFFRILAVSTMMRQAYDLESQIISDSLITSVETDLNVLAAASDLIKLLISGNQCVYLDSTLNNSENIDI